MSCLHRQHGRVENIELCSRRRGVLKGAPRRNPARVALRGRLKEMMLLTGGRASADSSTAGQCGSVGGVQGRDRAHGGGAVQGRAPGECPAAGERPCVSLV